MCFFVPTVIVCDPPCENGVCLANNTCNCSEGYSGDTCSDKGECVDNNHEQHKEIGNLYNYIHILKVFHDNFIITDSMECESNPCENGGTCTQHDTNFTCTCPSGYSGRLCEGHYT